MSMGLGRRHTVRRRRTRGRGFLDSIWSGIKSVAGPINEGLKSTKILSTLAGMAPYAGAKMAAPVISSLGYGKKKRRRRVGCGVRKRRRVRK